MGKRGLVVRLWLCVGFIGLHVVGCSQSKLPPPPTTATPGPVIPEKTKIVVLRLENSTKKGKADKSTGEDRLLGSGMRAQLVTALEQTGQFTVVANTGPRQVLQRDLLSGTGELKGAVRDRLGSLSDAEFLVAGVLTTYQLSKESKKAGVEADLLLRQPQVETVGVEGAVDVARKAFESLKVGADQVMVELWLFDAKTGKRLASTKIEGTPSDSHETLATPMQQAVRGSMAKAVNWISGTQTAFRAGTLTPPVVVETKKPPQSGPLPPKVTKDRRPKQPSVPASGEEKMESRIEEAEKTPPLPVKPPIEEVEKTPPPVAKTPETRREDWGSPPSQSAKKVEKLPPTSSAEQWGEQ